MLDGLNYLVYTYNAADPAQFTSYSKLANPGAIVSDLQGNAYIAFQNSEDRIGVLTVNNGFSSYISTVIAGNPTPNYSGIAMSNYGNYKYLYIATQEQYIVQVDITNINSPISTTINLPEVNNAYSIAIDNSGNFYFAELGSGSVWKKFSVKCNLPMSLAA